MDQGKRLSQKIQQFLQDNHVDFIHLEHEPTPTSLDAARVRGTKIEEGAKSIILKLEDGSNALLVLPGNLKINSKKVREYLNSKISFEDPLVILEKYGIVVGGVPPFANLISENLIFLIDKKVYLNEYVSFNCGLRTESIRMNAIDYKKVTENFAKVGEFSQEEI